MNNSKVIARFYINREWEEHPAIILHWGIAWESSGMSTNIGHYTVVFVMIEATGEVKRVRPENIRFELKQQ